MILYINSPEVRSAMLESLFEEETRLMGRLLEKSRKLRQELKHTESRISECEITRSGLLHAMNKEFREVA